MKTIKIILFGLDRELYEMLSPSAQKAYTIKVLALLVSLVMSIVVSVEITHAVTGEFQWEVVLPATGVWLFFVLIIDLALLRKGGAIAWFRLLFSVALVCMTTTSAFMFIARPDIIGELKTKSAQNVIIIDSTYNVQKEERYKALHDKMEKQREYYEKIVQPEALNIYPGPEFERKNAHSITLLDEIKEEKSILDTAEKPLYVKYLEDKSKAEKVTNPGLFDMVRKTYDYVFFDNIKIFIFIVLAVILLSIESFVFFISISSRNKEYDHLVKLKEDYLNGINEGKLQHWKSTEENTLENNKKFNGVKQKLDLLKSFHVIKEGFRQAKSVERELFSQETEANINMLLSTEIDVLQKDIDTELNEIYNAIKVTDTDDSSNTVEDDGTDEKVTEDVTTDLKNNLSSYYYSTFYATKPMKDLADKLWNEANRNEYKFCKRLFDWTVENITYQQKHDLEHYKTAREVFNSQSGICGEMAIFYNALLKYKGLKPDYVHIDVDYQSVSVNHACSGVVINDKYTLIDIAYKAFDINHQTWNKVSDNVLIQNMKRWNK